MRLYPLTARGVMEASALYEPPSATCTQVGPDALFHGKEEVLCTALSKEILSTTFLLVRVNS